MPIKHRTIQQVGVSALALFAAALSSTTAHAVCVAAANTSSAGTGVVQVSTNYVAVDCSPPSAASDMFQTSFPGEFVTGTPTSYDYLGYDGSGNDIVNISQDAFSSGSNNPTPVVIGQPGPGYGAVLDARSDAIGTLAGDDTVTMSSGNVSGNLDLGQGTDTFVMTGGSIAGLVLTDGDVGTGDDLVTMSGGSVGAIFTGLANDTVRISANAQIGTLGGDSVGLEDGNDAFEMTGGTLTGGVSGGFGADSLTFSGGTVEYVAGNEDSDTIVLSGTIAVRDIVSAGDGDDVLEVNGGSVAGDVSLGAGVDAFTLNAGTIGGSAFGEDGDDFVTVNGGTITGDIVAETVHLTGGTIGGDISGISGNTLLIQSGTNLTLRDGVQFRGTDAFGTLIGSDLARSSGSGLFLSQVFSGFSQLGLDSSTVGFNTNQGIADLGLLNGSTAFIAGNVSLLSPSGGAGNLLVDGSAVNFINGVANDVFNVGNLALNNATIAIDVDQATSQSDQLVAGGTFNASGANLVAVNLVGTPQFAGVTIIPVAPVAGEAAPTDGTTSSLFTISGVPATPGSLFAFDVITGANGGLYIRARAADLLTPLAPRVAIDSRPIEVVTATVDDITNDAIGTALGQAKNGKSSETASAFGIYSSGQLARVSHDGFDFSGPLGSGTGPSFSSDDFSIAGSVELDAAKYWGFDQNYGLNLGLYGGYASSDVSIDGSAGFAPSDGKNESGMFGAYSLFRTGTTYGLVSATGFLGNTDINNGVLNSTGEYDTTGYALTASAGNVYALGERLRFDLRGGVLGASFEGDPYTDSQGVEFGRSRISFGAVKFEPGLYGDFKLDNGMTASPYARMELQQRFGYKNRGSIEGTELSFEDADFSASFSTGVNVRVSEMTTLSSEIRTKLSADSQTFAGKFGLKVKF